VTARETCATWESIKPTNITLGERVPSGGAQRFEGGPEQYSALRAIDPSTGERRWEHRFRSYPSNITLDDLGQVRKSLPYQQPKKLRTAVNHQILWTEANAAPSTSGYLVNAAYRSYDNDGLDRTQNYLAQHQADIQPVSDRQAMGCSRLDNQGVCGRSHREIGFLASALTTSPDQDQGCK